MTRDLRQPQAATGEPAEPSAARTAEPAQPAEPVIVPHTELDPAVLRAVIESFVLREGTDYGEREVSLDQKVAHVLRQLERREARILFDPDTESVAIVPVARGGQRLAR